MTTQSIKDLNNYVMKSDIREDHVNVLSALFRALCKANQQGLLLDHSSDNPNIMTLDLDQTRHAMREYSGKLITNMEIIDALYDLHTPRLLPNSVSISRQGNNGHRIMPVRLDYSQPESPDNEMQETIDSSVEVFQRRKAALKKHNEELKSDAVFCTKMSTEDELDKCDASRRWIDYAMKLEVQHGRDKETIAKLRSVITELSETLQAADGNARISITSGELLELLYSNEDNIDTAF